MNGIRLWKQFKQCLMYSRQKLAIKSYCHLIQIKAISQKIITSEYDPLAIYGINDFLNKEYEFDYLITNPPYSNKDEIIARCIETGRPCVLVLPIDTLGGYKGINCLVRQI